MSEILAQVSGDAFLATLQDTLDSTSTDLSGLWLLFLQQELSSSSTSIPDLENAWLVSKTSSTGTTIDLWYTYLLSLGLTGTIPDMIQDFNLIQIADLWVGIGQSNMVPRDYAGGEDVIDYSIPDTFVPVNGIGASYADTSANVQAFTPAPDNFATLVPFEASESNASKMDGLAVASRRPTSLYIGALGAKDYTELRMGGGIFSGTVGAMTELSKAWRSLGYEPEILIAMTHGESDSDDLAAGGGPGSPTPPATYKLFLAQWYEDLTRIASLALERPFYKPSLFGINITYTGTSAYKDTIGAQTDFWLETDDCYHAGPAYPFPVEADRVHSTGLGNVLLGEMISKIAKYVELGEDWKPLYMLPFSRSGAIITIPVNVPRGNLTLDTTIVTEPTSLDGKYGLQYYYNTVEQTINTVVISDNNIIITLTSDPGASATEEVQYALQTVPSGFKAVPEFLARGNFRDEDTTLSQHDATYTLYNWMVNQKIGRAA